MKKHLAKAQAIMKIFLIDAQNCLPSVREIKFCFLPSPGSLIWSRFSGPYTVLRKVSEQNYIIAAPDRRKSNQLCNVNLLWPYLPAPRLLG